MIRHFFQFLLRYNPIRFGKIPFLNLLTRIGIASDHQEISTFDRGIKIKLNLDDWIQKQIYFFGVYLLERNETVFWRKVLKSGDIVLDIGANIGYYSLLASKRVGDLGKIFAFEPVPETYSKLVENIQINSFQNITPLNLTISDFDGSLELFIADQSNTGMASVSPSSKRTDEKINVPSRSINSFVRELGIDRIDLVKVDVEGSEMMVLRGMDEVLDKYSPTICVELIDRLLQDAGSSLEETWNYLASKNYFPHRISRRGNLIPITVSMERPLIVFTKANRQIGLKTEIDREDVVQ